MKNKNQAIILAIVVLTAVGGAAYYLSFGGYSPVAPAPVPGQEASALTPTAPTPSLTKSEVPPGTKVPEIGDKPQDENVAVPVSVVQSAPGVESKIRTYTITASKNLFDPSTVIANVGDTIHINFTATDKTYDITVPDYGLKQTAKKGETKVLEFQAVSEGKFLYYCSLCGSTPEKPGTTSGYIIVTKRS